MSLPKGWILATLGDLALYINGRGFKKSEWKTEGIPIIRIQNLNKENADFNYADDDFEEKYRVKNGDLLVAWSASLGAYIWNRGDAWLNQHIFRVDPYKVVDNNFLYYTILESISELYQKSHGMGMVHVTKGVFESHEVLLPPLNEQKRIAKKVDELLATVESTKSRLNNTQIIMKRFRKSILIAASTGNLTSEWREENGVNDEWRNTTLDQVILKKPKNGYSPKGVSYETPVKNLTLTATTSGKFIDGYYKYVDIDIENDSHLWLNPGDILIQRGNSIDYVGISAIYNGEKKKYIYPDLMMKILSDHKHIDNSFLHYVLLSDSTRQYFKDNATGTSGNMPKINQQVVMNTPLKLPSLAEQKEIVSQLESLFSLADLVEEKIEAAKKCVDKLTESILAKALKGELVPQDPKDEPAKKLLEHIKAEQEQAKPKKKISTKKINKSNKISADCTTIESLTGLLIKKFDKQEFTIEDVYTYTQCDKQKLIKFIFQLVKKQKFKVEEDTYEIYNLWKNDKQVLKISKVL